ncbi:MAE_28990/MAE_18760 family HEPN-like nuclease [Peribacillus simplex]|uniref:MAE_28990/MAE_18760 family HEPN-like nuclease n=1 Tax=Peribacillus simplex TaxID=1478 RepID=UPI003CF793CE
MMRIEEELYEELSLEVEWRISEISMIKSIPYLYRVTEHHKEVLQKYLIPAIYALWEGFVVKSFEIYIKKLNELNLKLDELHPCILAHDLDIKKGLKDGRTSGQKQVEFTLDLKEYFSSDISLSGKVPTKSNVKYKTINSILERFNLEKFPKNFYEFGLTKLLKYRNDIAHGENSLNVDKETVLELSDVVVRCMDKLSDILVDGMRNKSYLA